MGAWLICCRFSGVNPLIHSKWAQLNKKETLAHLYPFLLEALKSSKDIRQALGKVNLFGRVWVLQGSWARGQDHLAQAQLGRY